MQWQLSAMSSLQTVNLKIHSPASWLEGLSAISKPFKSVRIIPSFSSLFWIKRTYSEKKNERIALFIKVLLTELVWNVILFSTKEDKCIVNFYMKTSRSKNIILTFRLLVWNILFLTMISMLVCYRGQEHGEIYYFRFTISPINIMSSLTIAYHWGRGQYM